MEFFPTSAILLQIGPFAFHVYGAMYALGTLFCIWWLWWRMQYSSSPFSFDTASDIGMITLLAGVLGGRLFYVFVYNFSYFSQNFFDIFAVWNGGMSIHGGLMGGAFGFLWICRKKNIDWKYLADLLVPALAIALMLGRFGNFMNGELIGRPTDMWWGMDFGDGVVRHPATLYAMGKDFFLALLFGYIILGFQKNPFWKKGSLFFAFLFCYGIVRFCVEFFRAPDPQLGLLFLHLSMGQWLSLGVMVVGMVGVLKLHSLQHE